MNKVSQTLTFAEDVLTGLSANPKFLSSKYIYDQEGDKLFKAIMELDEYYLTNCEFEIFTDFKNNLLNLFKSNSESFSLVEFGSGDGLKTKILLMNFMKQNVNFKYVPIDISQHALDNLEKDLSASLPKLKVEGISGEYFKALDAFNKISTDRKVILFLGSNIGNFLEEEAVHFLSELKKCLTTNDLLLIGFDLKKDPNIILRAYNDPHGITRDFNLNLLKRINRELGGNFDIEKFKHFPLYNPETGTAKSYIISTNTQTVDIEELGESFQFDAWETIHTEISQKYDLTMINRLANKTGFRVIENFYDSRHYFADSVWTLAS